MRSKQAEVADERKGSGYFMVLAGGVT